MTDLLNEAADGAPPVRRSVDDVVAAARRRSRHRTAGWAAGVAVVVAVTVSVPQLITHSAAPRPPVAPGNSSAPVSRVVRAPDVTFSFRGYAAGNLRVADPDNWTLAGQTARITDPADGNRAVGVVTIFHPGVDPLDNSANLTTATEPIDERRAYFVAPSSDPSDSLVQLAWEFGDGVLAVVTPYGGDAMSRDAMREVAAGLRTVDPYPASIDFSVGYLPDGYRLSKFRGAAASFIPAREAVLALSRERRVQDGDTGQIVVEVQRAPAGGEKPSARMQCPAEGRCFLYREAGGPLLVVTSQPAIREMDARKVLGAITVGRKPVIEAVPEWYRLG